MCYIKEKEFDMKFTSILSLVACTFIAQSAFAAGVIVYNSTDNDLEVTARWRKNSEYKTHIISPGSKSSFQSLIYALRSLEWRNTNEGITHSIKTPSPRLMNSGGKCEIRPNGDYVINFNKKGIYAPRHYEEGNSTQNRAFEANRTY